DFFGWPGQQGALTGCRRPRPTRSLWRRSGTPPALATGARRSTRGLCSEWRGLKGRRAVGGCRRIGKYDGRFWVRSPDFDNRSGLGNGKGRSGCEQEQGGLVITQAPLGPVHLVEDGAGRR